MTIQDIAKRDSVIIACQPVSVEQLALEWLANYAIPSWPDGKAVSISLQLMRERDGRISMVRHELSLQERLRRLMRKVLRL